MRRVYNEERASSRFVECEWRVGSRDANEVDFHDVARELIDAFVHNLERESHLPEGFAEFGPEGTVDLRMQMLEHDLLALALQRRVVVDEVEPLNLRNLRLSTEVRKQITK
jgi:hypothetical protein